MVLKNNPTEPASCALGSCTDAVVNVTETASCDQLFRHVCGTLPPTASILPPTAVVDLVRQPKGGLKTPTRFTVANCSLTVNRVVTSGSTPAADNAALGDRNVPLSLHTQA